MEKVKLGDVCKVQGGYAFKSKEFQKDSIPIIRIGNIQDNEVEIDYNVCFTKEFLNKHPEFEIKYGDILIAMSGATVGKIGKYQNDTKALLNQRVGNFIVTEKLEKRYLYFLLQSPLFEKFILNNAFGCAQPNISSKQIEGFEFYNYDNVEQIEIANQLDKVQEIIDFRKKQIQELDELIKSQFVEMFGDPIQNDKNWDTDIINNVAPSQNYKGSFEDKVWLLNLDMVESNSGRIIDYVYENINNIGNSTCTFNEENILYSKLRPYLNKVVIPNQKGYATSELVPLRPNMDKINRYFLAYLLRSEQFVQYISEKVAGAKMPRVSMDMFRKFNLIIPPIELQNKFAEVVKQIDKQKFEIQKSLEETQKLQESLMNKYFG